MPGRWRMGVKMGWTDETGLHEGYMAGVERMPGSSYRWQEVLNNPGDRWPPGVAPDNKEPIPIEFVQVMCSCGWRSARLPAPSGTHWFPCSTFVAEGNGGFEDLCHRIWQEAHTQMLERHTVNATDAYSNLRCPHCPHDAHKYGCWERSCACVKGWRK